MAVLAGVVGMLSLTEARGGALVGVLVSVTTIPAASKFGVAAGYRESGEVAGAALQLGLNVATNRVLHPDPVGKLPWHPDGATQRFAALRERGTPTWGETG